jgi:gluconokinase
MTGRETPFVLALDVGTSSVRTLLFDRTGRVVDGIEGRRTYSVTATPDGGAEIDPAGLLRDAEEAIDAALGQAGGRAPEIAAVASCTFWHSLLGVDPEGKPVTPLYTWADTRAARAAADLRRTLDGKAVHARTGCVLHACYLPAKLLWLHRLHPGGFHPSTRWMSFGEFLLLRLFGQTRVGASMASASGLLDVHDLKWDPEVAAASGIRPDQLSPLGDEPLRGLKEPYAGRWPALREIPWYPPAGDGACSNLGSGCLGPDRVCVMVGTSGAMRVVRQGARVVPPAGLFCYRADPRRYVVGGALSGGGNLVGWMFETLKLGPPADVERDVAALEADAHGLTVLPFIAGERSPGWAAEARAAITGLNLHTRPIHIFRAGLESVALRFAALYELIREAAPQAREVVASGGALLGSPAWMQILSDALGCPITASAEGEASSRGAALLALESLRVIPGMEAAPARFGRTLDPDPARHGRYKAALERQKRLYGAIVPPGTFS